jgi:hypothetical protein
MRASAAQQPPCLWSKNFKIGRLASNQRSTLVTEYVFYVFYIVEGGKCLYSKCHGND